MTVSRATALRVRNALDNWLPPVLRDNPLVMKPLLRLALRRQATVFAEFRQVGFSLTADEFAATYRAVAGSEVQGETDLNAACTAAILREVRGQTVLEVGSGRGWLVRRMVAEADHVTASDIVIGDELSDFENVTVDQASAESLPYADNAFDVVVCTHTLEHVQDLPRALSELRRVARRRLVIVVPKERPYRFGFNLHLHFFPYAWSWLAVSGVVDGARLEDLDDWFYVEPVLAAP